MNREFGISGRDDKGLGTRALVYAVIAALLCALAGAPAIARGVLLGSLFSVANFFLLGRTIALILGSSRARARGIGLTSMLARYVIMAIPLIVGIKSASFDFVAVVAGLFSIQMVILTEFIVFRPLIEGRHAPGSQPRNRGQRPRTPGADPSG